MSQLALFNYSDLSPEFRSTEVIQTLENRAVAIEAHAKITVKSALAMGAELNAARQVFGENDKAFGQWREGRLPWLGRYTALNYMRAESKFGGKNLPWNDSTVEDLGLSILYELSRPNTDDVVIEQVLQDAETGETITLKDVKRLKAEAKQKKAELESTKQALVKKDNDLKGAELVMQDSAKKLAEKLTEKATEELTKKASALEEELGKLKSEKKSLEEAQKEAQKKLADAEESHQKALVDFKANPDPDTLAAIKATKKSLGELKGKEAKLSNELDALERRLKDARSTGENRAAMVSTVNNFFGLFEQAVEAHPNILIAVASPLVDDAHADRMEDMADFLEEFAGKIRKALADRQFNQATQVQAVEVEVLTDYEDEF